MIIVVTNITTIDQQAYHTFKIAVNIFQVEINLLHMYVPTFESLVIGFAINNRFYVFSSLLNERSILPVVVSFLANKKVNFIRRGGKMGG